MPKQEIMRLLESEGVKDAEKMLEVPADAALGDIAFPCFHLAKEQKKNPQNIAVELAEKVSEKLAKASLVLRIEAKSGYVNFFLNWSKVSEKILKEIFDKKAKYGSSNFGKAEKTVVEYCHANTHKGFHIGHFRNICLGEALCRVLEFAGYDVSRVNYEGDIGPHVAKCLWGVINLAKEKYPKENKGEWLGKIYAEANAKISTDEKLEQEVREINNKLYEGDKKIITLWKKTRQWSLDDFDKIYKELGAKFDKLYFESQVEKRAKEISKELLKKKIAASSEGAIIIDLTKHGFGIFVLLTKDGNPVYESKDLALAEKQFSDFKFDRCIHVVGAEQGFYFKQLFKVLELIKSPAAGKKQHLNYGLVSLRTGKMSSRTGTVILYTDLRDQILQKTREEVEKRNPKISKAELEKIAKGIGLGALKYGMLKISPEKTILFDWQSALELEGDTGPYIQYAHTRCSSILKKAGKWKQDFAAKELTEHEKKLAKQLAKWPEVVEQAAKDLRPHYVCNYAFDLATIFNNFYQYCPVLKAEEDLKNFRLTLVAAAKDVLAIALNLIGLEALEKM